MNTVNLLADAASGFNFTVDLNTVMMAFISILLAIIAWFGKGWMSGIKTEMSSFHSDMKEHMVESGRTHDRIFKAIAIDGQRISKIEGQLEGKDD